MYLLLHCLMEIIAVCYLYIHKILFSSFYINKNDQWHVLPLMFLADTHVDTLETKRKFSHTVLISIYLLPSLAGHLMMDLTASTKWW